MSLAERISRHAEMLDVIVKNDINHWQECFISDLKQIVPRSAESQQRPDTAHLVRPSAPAAGRLHYGLRRHNASERQSGVNINAEVGATDVRALQARVLAEKADLGIAFDGDGDRVIMVDHEGNKVDGDQIMYIIAREGLRSPQGRRAVYSWRSV